MELTFANSKLRKCCSCQALLERAYGRNARKIMQRLEELSAAHTLADISRLPPARCHPHKGNPPGRYTVDMTPQYRILFRVANVPIPRTPDGGIDMNAVTDIEIIDVRYDPH